MNSFRFAKAALAPLTLLLAGCAVAPSMTEGRINVDVSQYPEVQVRIESEAGMQQQDGYQEVAAQLLRSFVDNLRATGKFATVGMEGVAPGTKALDVRLNITAFNYVSAAARAARGIIAGRAILDVRMDVAAAGASVGVLSARHESTPAQGIFSPVSGRQAEAIGKELATRLATGK